MPTAFFADLVRELCHDGGTGPLTPSGAVPGHRRFADAVPPGVSFHYAIAGIAQPSQWETGWGHIDAGGRLVRDSVAASSAGGARTDFTPGLKTIALTVGAGWFVASEAARAALDANMTLLAGRVDGRQPLSTAHPEVATAAAGDLITVRRGSDWVNVPMATLPFGGEAGRHEFGGVLSAPGGSAGAPAISFTGDPDTGIFRPESNALAFAVGGSERIRIAPTGRVGIGRSDPKVPLSVFGPASNPVLDAADGAVELKFDVTTALAIGGGLGAMGYALWLQGKQDNSGYNGTAFPIALNPCGGNVLTGGAFLPMADNGISIGSGAARFATLYAATGAINTSDARAKLWRGPASPAELRAADRIIDELGFYQWQDAIAAKGADEARLHFGVRAQAVWAIMADEGLVDPIDPAGAPGATPYAFLCWDAWDAQTDGDEAEGQVVRAAGDRFGIRPDQLALFLIAALAARMARQEAGA